MMTEQQLHSHAQALLLEVNHLPVLDALKVINQAAALLLTQESEYHQRLEATKVLDTPTNTPEARFQYHRKLDLRSKIDSDPELRAFIYQLPVHTSQKEILRLCIEKFGKDRAPSQSAISRYYQNHSFQILKEQRNG